MATPRATGLVDDWQTVIKSPYGTIQPRSVTLNLRDPTPHKSPHSAPALMASVWSLTTLCVSYLHYLSLPV